MTGAVSPLAAGVSASTASAAPASAGVAKVAHQFEAVFLRQMIGAMRQASLSDGLFDSSAEDQFRDMGDAKLADAMANMGGHGGFGIADMLTRQLGKTAAVDGSAP